MANKLVRFLDAQNQIYLQALAEIKNGRKTSHWMWFIFPQIEGLGYSATARLYAIKGMEEAEAYMAHPVLRNNLVEISKELLKLDGLSANDIFGSPDDMKLCSSMTLFANVPATDPVFGHVLDKYFGGRQDILTLEKLQEAGSHHDAV